MIKINKCYISFFFFAIFNALVLFNSHSLPAQNPPASPKIYKDTIQIASEPNYPPFCILNKKGEADGFSVDLIKAAAEAMHLKLDIKVGPWNEIKKKLAQGKIDALPLVGRSPEREEVYDFTFPYHTMRGAVFVRKTNTDINKLSDLKNKIVAVMQGDNAHEYAIRSGISDSIKATETYDIAFSDLAKGKYDAVIAQKLMGLQLLNKLNIHNVKALDIPLKGFSQDFSFAVEEGNKELLSILNEGLSIIIADGTYDKLHKKWWAPIEEYKLSVKEIIVRFLPYIIAIIIILSVSWVIILRIRVRQKTSSLRQEIRERKKTEKELSKYRAHLEELVDMRTEKLKKTQKRLMEEEKLATLGKFAGGLAHEIKNPMAVIDSSLVYLQYQNYEDEKLKKHINRIRSSIKTTDEIINSLRSLSKIHNPEFKRLNLNDLIKKLTNKIHIPERIKLFLQVSDEETTIQADEIQLSLCLKNIIKNAVESIKDKGKIEIKSELVNKRNYKIVISDTGKGIDKKVIDKIFEPFYSSKSSGLGYGLSLVKQIVDLHNGEIKVESEPGKGTEFRIILPLDKN